jgi:outer membrane protein assembly factor BamB
LDAKFTRRRFLAAASAGAAYLTLINTVGCGLPEHTSKVARLRTPKARVLQSPVVSPLPNVSSKPPDDVWTLRSRPDLSPPAVGVTKEARSTAPGYVFVAPQKGAVGQGGSLIVDDRGQVVWFRPLPSTYGRPMDFKMQYYRGRRVLTWVGMVTDEYVIFDSSYREIARFTAANGYSGDHHEFLISPQDTALITIYDAVPWDLSSVGGPKNGVAVQGIVQELNIETGEVLFEWHSLEHVGLDETYGKTGEDKDYPGIDYFHINSIDVEPDNNLLISARKTSAVYKIDRKTGEVIWRLGGKKSDFEMGPGARFAFQHDARRQSDGTISIFDNGSTVFRNGIAKAVEESRGIVLELDEQKMKASLVREYTHPDKQYADAAGNMQVLPNGNVFVGWGRALAISEFSQDGKLLFDARLPAENKSYRAFRFPWSARPSDESAALAERTSEEEVRFYTSWNGATEVAAWEVLAGPSPSRLEFLGSVPRDGFETAMMARTSEPYVAAQARDSLGRVLGTTDPVTR